MTSDAIVTVFATTGVVVAALIGIRQLLSPYKKRLDKAINWFDDFKRDWSGEEESPGRDRTPGVMERLNRLDGELSSNGGSSTKDAVYRLEEKFDVLADAFVEMGERLISIENYLTVNPSESEK